jgi:hypothetical protein
MSVVFYFRDDGLSAARLEPDKPKEDADKIYSLLERTYGKPISSKSDMVDNRNCLQQSAEWKDDKGGNLVRFFRYSCIDIPQLKIKGLNQAGIMYLPLALSKDTGL